MTPELTPERIVALVVALVPVLSVIASVIIVIIQRRNPAPKPDPEHPPAVLGRTVERDDYAQAAIDAWQSRAEAAEQAEGELRAENRQLREELYLLRSQDGPKPVTSNPQPDRKEEPGR